MAEMEHKLNVHAITAISRGAYSDVWSLRAEETLQIDYDCMYSRRASIKMPFWYKGKWRLYGKCKDYRIIFHRSAPLQWVESAFNGLAVYKAAAIQDPKVAECRYSGWAEPTKSSPRATSRAITWRSTVVSGSRASSTCSSTLRSSRVATGRQHRHRGPTAGIRGIACTSIRTGRRPSSTMHETRPGTLLATRRRSIGRACATGKAAETWTLLRFCSNYGALSARVLVELCLKSSQYDKVGLIQYLRSKEKRPRAGGHPPGSRDCSVNHAVNTTAVLRRELER